MSSLTRQAEEAYRAGKGAEAEALCRKALAQDEFNPPAAVLLGVILTRTGRFDEANSLLTEALSREPALVRGWSWLSTARRRLGDAVGAKDAANRVIELEPDQADGYNKLGQAFMLEERLDEARIALLEACQRNPRLASAKSNLGLVCVRLGLEAEGETSLREALELEPGALATRISLGRLLIAMGRHADAGVVVRVGLAGAPNAAELHLLMAQSLGAGSISDEALGAAGEAGRHLSRCLEIEPGWSEAHASLGWLEQMQGAFDKARTAFERSIELEPNQGLSYLGLTRSHRASEADRPLLAKMEGVVAGGVVLGKELSYLHYALAKSYDELDELERAAVHYESANRLSFEIHRPRHPFSQSAYAEARDRTMSIFTRDALAKSQTMPAGSPTPILIVGVMRSGTTLLEQILASHPQVAGCGELRYLREDGPLIYLPQGKPPGAARLRLFAESYLGPMRAASRSGAQFATDKMPHNYEELGLFHLAFPNAPIVYIRRNPIDTCLSIYMTPYSEPPAFAYDKRDIMFVYEQHLKLMEYWRSALPPGRIFELRYEELVVNREPAIRRLLEYCDLPWDEACLSHERTDRIVRTPSHWQVRQPVYRSSMDRWRRYEPWLGEFAEMMNWVDAG